MLSSQSIKTLLYLKGYIRILPQTLNLNPIFPQFLSTISQNYRTITSDQHSFTVSYLINNCGFSLESALTASKQVRFHTAEKPDFVIAFFRNHGFSNSQIYSIIRRAPNVLTCNPHKRVLPKFEFLRSNGASSSDIVLMVTRSPRLLYSSLKNCIIPKYELVRRFFQSDKKAIDCVVICPTIFANHLGEKNVKLLIDFGLTESNISHLFRTRPSILLSKCDDLREAVNEVKEMGFVPSKNAFVVALLAKRAMAKSRWDEKVEAFKSWGWSEENIMEAFMNKPSCMLSSKDKINEVMRFWVSQLGWDSLLPVKRPEIFGFSLEKRIIPRAFVIQYLLAKGLIKKNASLSTPFVISEKYFLDKYVNCFKDERSQLLKLFQEKMNVQDNKKMV